MAFVILICTYIFECKHTHILGIFILQILVNMLNEIQSTENNLVISICKKKKLKKRKNVKNKQFNFNYCSVVSNMNL